MIAVNLYSAYHLTRKLIGSMMKQKSGHIFNMCSIASLNAYANGGAYSISKFALHGFSKNLREEMKPYGIKVSSVFPGAVLTDSWGDFDNSNQRIMEAQDIAKLVFAAAQLSPAACVEDIIIRPQLGDL
jgi:short-subunit dehydrogenase